MTVIEGNVALSSNGTVAVGADQGKNMLDGKIDNKFAKLLPGNPCMIILAETYQLSTIRFRIKVVGREYALDVSSDGRSYTMIADRSRRGQRKGWQTHTFPTRPVNFIRLTGTNNAALYVVEFEAAYCRTPAKSTNSSVGGLAPRD